MKSEKREATKMALLSVATTTGSCLGAGAASDAGLEGTSTALAFTTAFLVLWSWAALRVLADTADDK